MVKKGEGIFSKFRGELANRGSYKIQGGFGPWMKLWCVCVYWRSNKLCVCVSVCVCMCVCVS